MAEFNDRYGIPGTEINSLNRRWNRIKHDSIWESFDDFLIWCARNDYEKGVQLTKIRKSLPHGPENSRLVRMSDFMKSIRVEKPGMIDAPECDFCKGCTKACNGNGCAEYKKWFVKRWNAMIHSKAPKPVVIDFRYEHPDLIREGILWHG